MSLMHHLQCTEEDIGKYVFLPGDPGRVPVIASYLEDAKPKASNREYVTWTGSLSSVKVSVVSTGIGCPSAAIALEELIKLGAHTFIRIGTCGCIDDSLLPGNCIIATGAVRRDGTSLQYMPIEYPAVANQEIISALMTAAEKHHLTAYTGIVESKDSYYGQHEPDNSPVKDMLNYKWNCLKKGGVLGSEMECSALFVVSGIRKVRAGAILHIMRNREREKLLQSEPSIESDTAPTIQAAVSAMELLIEKDLRS